MLHPCPFCSKLIDWHRQPYSMPYDTIYYTHEVSPGVFEERAKAVGHSCYRWTKHLLPNRFKDGWLLRPIDVSKH